MKKTISLLMFLFVISGGVFSACNSVDAELKDSTDSSIGKAVEYKASDAETRGLYGSKENSEKAEDESVIKKKSGDISMSSSDKKEPVVTVKYVDGSYTQTGGYQSPAGPETVKVVVTLKGDVVSAVTVTPMATNENSVKFQGQFVAGISSLVVGKKLDEIGGFAQVNGSSLTPKGFDAALAVIKADALILN